MSNLTLEDLPNPFTPMAFLSPTSAYQMTVTTYVVVGALGVLVWDIITHLRADWKLITGFKTNLPTMIYLLSRWSSLLYSVTTVVVETAPLGNCIVYSRLACAVYHVAVGSTTLLFFLRVRAVYEGNKYITAVFFVMWLAVLVTSLTVIFSLAGVHIGPTKYCTFSEFKTYGSSANITICIFDTCVFGAITWRLISIAQIMPKSGSKSKSTFGYFMPSFSRALLQDGQNYYMVAVVGNMLVLIMAYAKGIPTVYRTMFFVPIVGLTNIMACRVFRNTKFGRYNYTSTNITDMFRHTGHGVPTVPICFGSHRGHPETDSTISRNVNQTVSVNETYTPSDGYSVGKLHLSKVEDLPV